VVKRKKEKKKKKMARSNKFERESDRGRL